MEGAWLRLLCHCWTIVSHRGEEPGVPELLSSLPQQCGVSIWHSLLLRMQLERVAGGKERIPQSVEAHTDDLLWGDLRPHRVIFVAREKELLKCAENKSFPMTGPTLGAGGEIGIGWRTRGNRERCKDAKSCRSIGGSTWEKVKNKRSRNWNILLEKITPQIQDPGQTQSLHSNEKTNPN